MLYRDAVKLPLSQVEQACSVGMISLSSLVFGAIWKNSSIYGPHETNRGNT